MRLRLLIGFLLRQAEKGQGKDELAARIVEAAVGTIQRCHGNLTVKAMGSHLGVSERQLERYFSRAVGVSPKAFARITRVRAAYSALKRGEDCLSVVHRFGYFDQAHLYKDMQDLGEGCPRGISRAAASDVGFLQDIG